jgi:hypothetical protein
MKFSGFIGFIQGCDPENESVVRFKKIVVARENSANFDFLAKTANFQQFLKIFFKIQYELCKSICSLRPI